jgi:pSer/pThr/pTyr-binding forkhead associated (FHA) protein
VEESPLASHSGTPAELKERIAAERLGVSFLVYRDGGGNQRIFALADERSSLTVGRAAPCDLRIDWDPEVSGVHAELARLGDAWAVVDDGLSRNGTFVNGERLTGRHRLRDKDTIRLGHTVVAYRGIPQSVAESTATSATNAPAQILTESQRRVLAALCRPYASGDPHAQPATNQAIADELSLSIPGVKTHLRALFQRFDLPELPGTQKRRRLVEVALRSGAISRRDL